MISKNKPMGQNKTLLGAKNSKNKYIQIKAKLTINGVETEVPFDFRMILSHSEL